MTEGRGNFEEKIQEQYAAIGRFVVEFELICDQMRFGVVMALQMMGLSKQSAAQILLGHSAMTAKPLLDVYRAIIVEHVGRGKHIDAIFKELADRFEKLIQIRNQYVHGTWYIGWGSEGQTDFSEFSAYKSFVTKKGHESRAIASNLEEILENAKEAKRIMQLVGRLNGVNMPPIPGSPVKTGDEWVRLNFKILNGKHVPHWAEDDGPWQSF